MSFALRVSLCLLALNPSLISPASTQTQPSSSVPNLGSSSPLASTPGSSQSSDEETIRALTEKYGLAIAAGNLEAMRPFWNPQSPNLASRLRLYQGVFSNSRIEFISLKVTRLEVTGEKAVSHLTTDERQVDKKTGFVVTERDTFHGTARSIDWIKTGAGWRIEREYSLQEELVARLENVISEDDRRDLLEKEKILVTDALVRALIQRSDYHRMRGGFDTALRCLRLAQAVAEKIGDEVGIAKAWQYLGAVKESQDDYEQALPFRQRSLELYEAAGNKLGMAVVLSTISHTYHELGDFRKAFECAQKSLRLSENIHHRAAMARALTELAHVYNYQNNPQQALACFERAMLINQELDDKIQIAILRFGIVKQYQELGNYDWAIEIYQDLLKQTEGHGDRVGAAVIQEAIGRIHALQGQYAEAREFYLKSLQASKAANFKDSILSTLVQLSETYRAEDKYVEALPVAEEAVAMARQTGNQYTLYTALTSLGYCQLGLNHPAEARQAFTEAISIIEALRAQAVGGVEERQRYFEIGLQAHHGMLGLLLKDHQTQEGLAIAERAKARVLLDVLQQGGANIQKAMTAEEREQEQKLKSELTILNMQLTHAKQSAKPNVQRISEIEPRLEKARLNYESFQTALYVAHPELKNQRGEAPIIKAEELAALLPDTSSALLEYVVTDDQTYLFVITKQVGRAEAQIQHYTLPIRRDELARQTEAFRQELGGRDLGFRASAAKLYQLLLKPAETQLRGKSNLVIVPDDKLWDLPFQALLVHGNRFLIEDAVIAYAPSLTVLREMRAECNKHRAEASTSILLAFGNPLIDREAVERTGLALRDEKLNPLPTAEQEVRALGHLYGAPRSKVYIGAEAREDRLKAEAGRARILHLATHGILNNTAPLYSHLVFAQGDKNEDGLLEAWELMQLDLKADLAVLSACETARGRFGAGEGMIGLTWALFVAGVPSTVVSQWKVESASTRDLMLDFHRRLRAPAKGPAMKAEALRQAALKLMKNPGTSHPFYWAGFVLVGDGS